MLRSVWCVVPGAALGILGYPTFITKLFEYNFLELWQHRPAISVHSKLQQHAPILPHIPSPKELEAAIEGGEGGALKERHRQDLTPFGPRQLKMRQGCPRSLQAQTPHGRVWNKSSTSYK